MRRHTLLSTTAAALSLACITTAAQAGAAGAIPAQAANKSAIAKVRWVCAPRRCAFLPGYEGRVIVHPYMRGWARPPHPNCHYVRGPERWGLVCP